MLAASWHDNGLQIANRLGLQSIKVRLMTTSKVSHVHSNPPPVLAYIQSACLPTHRGGIYGLTLFAFFNYLPNSCLRDLRTYQFHEVECALYARVPTRSVNGPNVSGIQLAHKCSTYWLNGFCFFPKCIQPSLGHSSEWIGSVHLDRVSEIHRCTQAESVRR